MEAKAYQEQVHEIAARAKAARVLDPEAARILTTPDAPRRQVWPREAPRPAAAVVSEARFKVPRSRARRLSGTAGADAEAELERRGYICPVCLRMLAAGAVCPVHGEVSP